MQSIDESRNGGQIDLALGEEFEVELAENPTSGYRWFIDDLDGANVAQTGDTFDLASPALGASGRRRWRFRAEREGDWRLQFRNRRSWERSAARSFELTVRVKPA